jgi:hypothetical protein
MVRRGKRRREKHCQASNREQSPLDRSWWAGFTVLMTSLLLLSLCTFFRVENEQLVEIWKDTFFASLGYILGTPIRRNPKSNKDSH